jgi:uncharacterized membrane protein YqjE
VETAPPPPPGLLDSLRTLTDGLLATVQDRVALLSLELQEEKFRLIQTFVLISLAVFSGFLALAFGSLALVYLFWEQARIAVLGLLALFYAAVAFGIVLAFRRHLARLPRPLTGTLEELAADRTCIRREN